MMVAPKAVGSVGLISDTHGLLRHEALTALKGSDFIIHAGDVGSPQILEQLRALAPVVAVRGNVDKGTWASRLPPTAIAEAGSAVIYVLHDLAQLDFDPASTRFNVIVSGHSHKPKPHGTGWRTVCESRECRPTAFSISEYGCTSAFKIATVAGRVHTVFRLKAGHSDDLGTGRR